MSDPVPSDIVDDREEQESARREVVEAVVESVRAGDRIGALALIDDMHPADIADLIEQIDQEDRRLLIDLTWDDIDPEVLVELEEGVRDNVLKILNPTALLEAAKELDTDDVVYLVEDLAEDAQREVLEGLEPADRIAVEDSLTYPEYSAGRLMERKLVKAPPFWTVGQMIDHLRSTEDLPDPFYDVIIVDALAKPIGKIPLSRIMGARRPVTLDSLMDTDFQTLSVLTPQEDVAYTFNKYHIVSAPVTDETGRMIGIISIDDAMEALEEEADEDIKRLGGVGDEEISDRVWETTRQRFPWLAVNLLTAVMASLVISIFDATIQQVVALAVLMPIVASMGGNAGTQTLTVAVRAIATRDLTATNMMRIVGRETLVGSINGVGFAVIVGAVTYLWFGSGILAAVISAAMVVNMVVAGLSGILIPIALDRLKADPALASGTFVTTVTDVVGFFAFLGLAQAVLL